MSERTGAQSGITRQEVYNSAENLTVNPPKIILVFDNWRGASPSQRQLAEETMEVRSAIAAFLYHSDLYPEREKPTIYCFAGEHQRASTSGSERVAKILRDRFEIPQDHVFTRRNTITTRTDLMMLRSVALHSKLSEAASIAIATTNDHVKRTAAEWANHFETYRWHGPQLYVLGPSTKELADVRLAKNTSPELTFQIMKNIVLGKTDQLDHGWKEHLAYLAASIPSRPLRNRVQAVLEKRELPWETRRIYRAARAMSKAGHFKRKG